MMPLDLNNPNAEPTLGLCIAREGVEEEPKTREDNIRLGLRSNHYEGGGSVRKIKINGQNLKWRKGVAS
jgi:hypothetical protein